MDVGIEGRRFAFHLHGGSEAAVAARRALVAADGEVPPSVRDDALLLLTELVTNAVRHGGVGPAEWLSVEVRLSESTVWVAVDDPGGSSTPSRRSTTDEAGGWGLLLVDQIADRWGVSRDEPGTRVWFELACAA